MTLSNRLKKLYSADHCLIVFFPKACDKDHHTPELGYFYDFDSGQLYSLDVTATIFEDLLHVGNEKMLSSMSFPTALTTTQH
jgi:hypothetical protein